MRAINFTPAGQQHYEDLRTDVLETVERINKQFPRSIIFVELPTISMQDRMQLWELADVAAFTPIREGVNTFALEAVRQHCRSPCSSLHACAIHILDVTSSPPPMSSSFSSNLHTQLLRLVVPLSHLSQASSLYRTFISTLRTFLKHHDRIYASSSLSQLSQASLQYRTGMSHLSQA